VPKGPRGEKRPADANQLAKLIVDIASGERDNDTPKDPAAVALGRKGGQKRASVVSPERRREIARQAAQTRWAQPEKKERT
jgi:hypothetical protein